MYCIVLSHFISGSTCSFIAVEFFDPVLNDHDRGYIFLLMLEDSCSFGFTMEPLPCLDVVPHVI
jgi:hypothetical protein